MELISDLKQGTGSMPIRWCLSAEEQQQIVDAGHTTLYVVIDTYYGKQQPGDNWLMSNNSDRVVVPIDRFMHYLTFRRPGLAHICVAVIAASRHDSKKDVEKMLIKLRDKTGNSYDLRLFAFSSDADDPQTVTPSDMADIRTGGRLVTFAHQTVEVPEEYFGKPLTGALKWWVEWMPRTFLRRPLIDECDQRRWFLFAFTLQPIVFPLPYLLNAFLFLLMLLINGIAVFYYGVLFGYRGIDYGAVLRGDTDPKEIKQSIKHAGYSSVYVETADRKPYGLFRQLCQPTTVAFFFCVWLVVTPLVLLSAIASLTVLVVGVASMVLLARTILVWFSKRSYHKKLHEISDYDKRRLAEEAEAKKRAAARVADAERMRGLVSELACPLVPVVASYDRSSLLRPAAVPLRHRTLRLHYEAIKSRVCRPLSRS